MATSSIDSQGLTTKDKATLLSLIPMTEIKSLAADLTAIKVDIRRDMMTYDYVVMMTNTRTGVALKRHIPEHYAQTAPYPNNSDLWAMAMTANSSNPTYGAGGSASLPASGVAAYGITSNGAGAWATATLSSHGKLSGVTIDNATVSITDTDVKIKGHSLSEFMASVEERLAILMPNAELEKEWDELREARAHYLEVEARVKEKAKTWELLNKEAK